MTSPDLARSEPAPSHRTVVLIPIRSFAVTKSRLADALSQADRRALSQAMARRVVAAAAPLPVRVVTDDAETAQWARDEGAAPLMPGVTGLNPSITAAVTHVAAEGFDRAIIAHADLPAAADLRRLDHPGVCLAPDRDRDGSNVLSVPTGAGFVFAYGPGSFERHRAEARRLGLHLSLLIDPDLAWDIDDPDDLPDDWRGLLTDEPVTNDPIAKNKVNR